MIDLPAYSPCDIPVLPELDLAFMTYLLGHYSIAFTFHHFASTIIATFAFTSEFTFLNSSDTLMHLVTYLTISSLLSTLWNN